MYISPKLTEAEYAEGKVNELLEKNNHVTYSDDLHLSVSLRSFRAEKLSAFVHSLLSFEDNAAELYQEIKDKYPIVLTRDIQKAKSWLHQKVRGSERTGVLVTKESARSSRLEFIYYLPAMKMQFIGFWMIRWIPDLQIILRMPQRKFKCKDWN